MSHRDDTDTRPATTAVRPGQAFDEAGLARWMSAHVDGFAGPLTVLQFEGGQSSPTYQLITPGARYVLRRKPPGPILKGAHAVDREARVIAALGPTGFPVPKVHGLCMDDGVIGTAFYVMDMVEGRIFRDATFPQVDRAERPAYFDAMNDAIARLHRIDPVAIGLADYGRPGNYYARQVARLAQQYLADTEAGRLDDMDRLVEWLPANLPPDEEPRIVHGDFRAANMIFHPTEPRVLAVLDWELSTLGAPLADFGFHAMMYRMLPEILPGLARADLAALNIPSERDYVAAYCRRTRRASIPRFEFYLAFSLFRYAALLHGIKARALRGTASSAHAHDMARHLPAAARLAREVMDSC